MGHKRRGTVIIINNKDFHPSTGLNTRDGTNLDASRLEGTFLGLGFQTEVYHNRTAMQILTIVEQGKSSVVAHRRENSTLVFLSSSGETRSFAIGLFRLRSTVARR